MPVTNTASGVKPGTIAYHAASAAPAGWLKCNGAAVSRTLYAALFNEIGTTYGAGDGATTFNIPDARGEFLRSWDDSRGVDAGRTIGSTQNDAMQGHQHQKTGGYIGGSSSAGIYYDSTNNAGPGVMTTDALVTDGTNGTPRTASETRPRNVTMLACIKY